jgi:hypothetical protein
MDEVREVFVGIDVAKARKAIAVTDGRPSTMADIVAASSVDDTRSVILYLPTPDREPRPRFRKHTRRQLGRR